MGQILRDYQQHGVQAALEAWGKSEKTILSLATGLGKTTVGAEVLRRSFDPLLHRALVLGPTREIIDQFSRRLVEHLELPEWTGFAPSIGVVCDQVNEANARIVVATWQSLHDKRLKYLLDFGAIDFLIIDECHEASAGSRYDAILAHLARANSALKVLGLSATPYRSDGKPLKALFDSICYTMNIEAGIKAGYLVPPTRMVIGTKVNLADVETSHGDYNQKQLSSVLEAANWLDIAVDAYTKHIQPTNRQTLAYFPEVGMSRTFAERLNDLGVTAVHIDGETPKPVRDEYLIRYSLGEIQVVVNFGVLTRGFDAPWTGAILYARPTRSRVLLTQIIGRGLRLYPNKQDCLVLDLTVEDNKVLRAGTLEGRTIKCPSCLAEVYAGFKTCPLCGAEMHPARLARLKPNAAPGEEEEEQIGFGDILSADNLDIRIDTFFENLTAVWIKADKGQFVANLMGGQELRILPPNYTSRMEYELYWLDYTAKDKKLLRHNGDLASLMIEADTYAISVNRNVAKDAPWRSGPASEKQIALLRKLGFNPKEGLTKGEASALIDSKLGSRSQ